MKLYKVHLTSSQAGHQVTWCGTQKEAIDALLHLQEVALANEETLDHQYIEPFNIASTKKAILYLLNQYTSSTENG